MSRLTVRSPLRAETGDSASIDVTRAIGPFSAAATLFASRIHNPLLWSAPLPTRSPISRSRPRTTAWNCWRRGDASLLVNAAYGYVRAREYENTAF
jgi:hypothetical protein